MTGVCYYTGTRHIILLFMFLLMHDNMKIFFQVMDFNYGLIYFFIFSHLPASIKYNAAEEKSFPF